MLGSKCVLERNFDIQDVLGTVSVFYFLQNMF